MGMVEGVPERRLKIMEELRRLTVDSHEVNIGDLEKALGPLPVKERMS